MQGQGSKKGRRRRSGVQHSAADLQLAGLLHLMTLLAGGVVRSRLRNSCRPRVSLGL